MTLFSNGAFVCSEHPLDGDAPHDGVATAYTPPTPLAFAHLARRSGSGPTAQLVTGDARPAGWHPEARIGHDDTVHTSNGSPRIAIDDAGNVLFAWNDQERTFARRYVAGTWSEPVQVGAGGGNQPAVAVSADGLGVVTWRNGHTLQAVTYGGVWSSETTLATCADNGNLDEAQIALGATGDGFIAFNCRSDQVDNASVVYAVRVTRTGAGLTFGAPVAITPLDTPATDDEANRRMPDHGKVAVVVVGNELRGTVAWEQRSDSNYRDVAVSSIVVDLVTNQGDWSAPTLLDDHDDDAFSLQVARSAEREVVCWASGNNDIQEVHVASRTGGAWSADTRLDTDHNNGPALAIDASGNALVVWREFSEVDGNYFYSRSYTTTGVGPPVRLESFVSNSGGPWLAMSPDGDATLVWGGQDDSGNTHSLFYTDLVAGTWTPRATLEHEDYRNQDLSLARGPDGLGVAASAQEGRCLEFDPRQPTRCRRNERLVVGALRF